MMETTVEELAAAVDGSVEGDGRVTICGIANIEDAKLGDVTFAENSKLLDTAGRSAASAVIAPATGEFSGKPLIRVKNPRFAFAQVLRIFAPEPKAYQGIHPSVSIGKEHTFGANVSIHANVVIGDNVRIGSNSIIYPFTFVGDNVTIGENCVIYPQVVLHDDTLIGDCVVIHSGSVLGTDGFGYMFIEDRHYKIPQIGRVVIEDDVEIGANTTIDKARTGSTIIGRGTKIDNLVHIAHNCTIGRNCVIVAQVGIAGSVNMGAGVILAGQVGIKDHLTIGDGVIVTAKGGVMCDLPNGSFVGGFYGRPHQSELRKEIEMERLPVMRKKVNALEKRLAEMEKLLKLREDDNG